MNAKQILRNLAIFGLAGLILLSCNKTDENSFSYIQFTDNRDGNTYKTIQIGTQIWMAENLNYDAGMGSWIYDENSSLASTYGRLYDWETACGACPEGWHLPSDEEWTALTDFLGGEEIAGGKLKETGTAHWESPNEGATNESGFSALPGGGRFNYGDFDGIGISANFWSSTAAEWGPAYYRTLGDSDIDVYRDVDDNSFGRSVRCVKD